MPQMTVEMKISKFRPRLLLEVLQLMQNIKHFGQGCPECISWYHLFWLPWWHHRFHNHLLHVANWRPNVLKQCNTAIVTPNVLKQCNTAIVTPNVLKQCNTATVTLTHIKTESFHKQKKQAMQPVRLFIKLFSSSSSSAISVLNKSNSRNQTW